MISTLGKIDIAIWIVLAVAQGFLWRAIISRRLWKRLPGFAVYALVSSADTVILLVIGLAGSYESYYHAFYFGSKIVSALAFLALIEIARILLSSFDLPGERLALALLVGAMAACIAFAWLWPMASQEKRIELGAFAVISMAFLFLFLYSLRVGLYWSKLLALIAGGFLLRFAVQSIAKAMIGHWPSPDNRYVIFAREVSMGAHIAAIGLWMYAITSCWREKKLTDEDAGQVLNIFADTESAIGEAR